MSIDILGSYKEYLKEFKVVGYDDDLFLTKVIIKTNKNEYHEDWDYKLVKSKLPTGNYETIHQYDMDLKKYCKRYNIDTWLYEKGLGKCF